MADEIVTILGIPFIKVADMHFIADGITLEQTKGWWRAYSHDWITPEYPAPENVIDYVRSYHHAW